jgi:hypothetical protein
VGRAETKLAKRLFVEGMVNGLSKEREQGQNDH